MTDFLRILLVLVLAGGALSLAATWLGWWNEEQRRLTRLMAKVLDGPADAQVIARGRNAAAGFSLERGEVAVMRDGGARTLVYPLDALLGAELIIDDAVAARVYRGEPRRPLDAVRRDAHTVALRLVFDNPRDPDFELDLWPPGDRGHQLSAQTAVQEARTWIARADAILRRPGTGPAVMTPAPAPVPGGDDADDEDAPF